MIEVKQFRYGADNFGYLVQAAGDCLAIDGGAADAMLSSVAERHLSLLYVANTHSHADHTCGNRALLAGSRARLLSRAELLGISPVGFYEEAPPVYLGGEAIRIIATPGHTEDSLCFYTGQALIGGDTLFNGTIGNCFSGDIEAFYCSVRKLMALPDETVVYAGHDYVRDSLSFARHLEPENPAIDDFLKRYDPGHVFSTIAGEKQINPYFRFNEPSIVRLLAGRGLPVKTEWERWQSLMSIE
jgi:hydroxyacylglutathione hydrolase